MGELFGLGSECQGLDEWTDIGWDKYGMQVTFLRFLDGRTVNQSMCSVLVSMGGWTFWRLVPKGERP